MSRRKPKKEAHVPILNSEYWVYVYWGDKDYCLKEAKKYFEDDEISRNFFDDRRGVTLLHKKKNPIIWVGEKESSPTFFATLAHEAVHAIDYIFDVIGEHNSDEVFAHCVGAVVREVEQKVKGKK